MAPPFPRRGIIEGFYGEPWSHEARVEVIEFVAERGMNAYVYAPKDEPKHRARWREPYDGEEHARLADLAARCAKVGVRFGFAVSPGLDLDNTSATDRAALLAKLLHLLDAGTDWFVVALDDIPRFAKLGVIASMQSTHQISDMGWAQARLGPERVLGAYAWRSLLDSGAVIRPFAPCSARDSTQTSSAPAISSSSETQRMPAMRGSCHSSK